MGGKRKTGYFIENGRAGFMGAVGGPNDPEKDDLWDYIETSLRHKQQPGFSTKAVQTTAEVQKNGRSKREIKDMQTSPKYGQTTMISGQYKKQQVQM